MNETINALFRRFDYQKYACFIALIILFTASSILSPYFFQVRNLLNILRQVSYTGIIALGMTFVIISGGIDLSVGSVAAFNASVGILFLNYLMKVFSNEFLAMAGGIIAALVMGFLSGAMNGLMVSRGNIAPFIATLGSMAIFRSLSLFIGSAGEIRSVSIHYGNFGMESILFIPVPVFVMLFLTVVLSIVLNNTRYGRYLCAVGSNARVAAFSAINVDRIKFITYTICGFIVSISAIMLSSRFNAVSTSNLGMGFELDAIAAVIIGGTPMSGGRGTVWGTIMGAVILGIINNMLNMLGVSPYLQGTVKGLVIIGAVYIQRQKA
ncbi:MAG: ribose ABC transporter permease [Spirochaetes bacterium DG_61]|jgi:ribose transport system permease protein|nr:MAG: ribose ABC transporter permease [Spirochaetes bacterium DG_61]